MKAINETISVIMPVFNGQKYLVEAIECIINQTFHDFILYIVDDCSTDNTPQIISKYVKKHPHQIKALKTPSRLGRGLWVLNWAIPFARGKYIAFADGDDKYSKERLYKQFKFLEANSEIFAVGTSGYLINEQGEILKSYQMITQPHQIYKRSFNNIVVRIPTLMIRKAGLSDQNYFIDEYEIIADWWSSCRKIISGFKFANLPDKLHYYRIHDENFSKKRARRRRYAVWQTLKARVKMVSLGYKPTLGQMIRSFIYFNLAFLLPDYFYKRLFDSKSRWKYLQRFDQSRIYKL